MNTKISVSFFVKEHTEVRHDVPQFGGTDVPISILVENFERLLDFLFRISVPHLSSHHSEELWEIDRAISVGVDFVDHVLQLCFCWVLPQRPHDCAQFFGGDGTVAVCAVVA
jgi:hypothetical protein